LHPPLTEIIPEFLVRPAGTELGKERVGGIGRGSVHVFQKAEPVQFRMEGYSPFRLLVFDLLITLVIDVEIPNVLVKPDIAALRTPEQ
jgi:hypothetical protein